MIKDKKLNLEKLSRKIFFNKSDLIKLSSEAILLVFILLSSFRYFKKKVIKNNMKNILKIKNFEKSFKETKKSINKYYVLPNGTI